MLNLIKYEVLRRQKLLIILGVCLALSEAIVLLGINRGERLLGIAILLIFIMVFGTIILIFADSIRTHSIDLNKKEGYMLFMTPNSGYKILGAKMIVNFITLLLAATLVFFLMYLNFQYAKVIYYDDMVGPLKEIAEAFSAFYGDAIPGLGTFFLLVGTWLLEVFGYIMVAMFALTMRKTIFAQARYGGFASFVIFIIIIITMQTINAALFTAFSFFGDYISEINAMSTTGSIDSSVFLPIIRNMILFSIGLWLVYIGAFFGISGRLLDKRIDL